LAGHYHIEKLGVLSHFKLLNNNPKKMSSGNLATRAIQGTLKIKDIKRATKEKLETDFDEDGSTVLMCACSSCSVDVVEAILDKGIDVNTLSPHHYTPLITAAAEKQWDTIKLLVQRGANGKLSNIYNKNALHYAAFHGAPDDIIKSLIDAGANPTQIDTTGLTPSGCARTNSQFTSATCIEQYYYQPTKSANLIA
jgi:ankyrin repeat protein